jgi:hypothetical protein
MALHELVALAQVMQQVLAYVRLDGNGKEVEQTVSALSRNRPYPGLKDG